MRQWPKGKQKLLAFGQGGQGVAGDGTGGKSAGIDYSVKAAGRTDRHGASQVTQQIIRSYGRGCRLAVFQRPLLDGAVDLAEVVNARIDLCLRAGGVLQLLGLGKVLRGGGARGFGLGLHALDLRLGSLSLSGELLVLITDLANFVAQVE